MGCEGRIEGLSAFVADPTAALARGGQRVRDKKVAGWAAGGERGGISPPPSGGVTGEASASEHEGGGVRAEQNSVA